MIAGIDLRNPRHSFIHLIKDDVDDSCSDFSSSSSDDTVFNDDSESSVVFPQERCNLSGIGVMSWGEKLWDRFDIIDKHTEKGIEFSRKFLKFVEDYCAKKREHSSQIKKLVKHYNVNYKKGGKDGREYTYEAAFYQILEHISDMAELENSIVSDLESTLVKVGKGVQMELTTRRKQYLSAGRDHNIKLNNSLKLLEAAELNFRRACKARDEAQVAFDKADADMNVTKALVAKCRQTLETKKSLMELARKEYMEQLKKTNCDQHDHYFTQMPLVFDDLHSLDTERIQNLQSLFHQFVSIHEQYQGHMQNCFSGIHAVSDGVDPGQDTNMVVLKHETGRVPPSDRLYVDYSAPGAPSASSSATNSLTAAGDTPAENSRPLSSVGGDSNTSSPSKRPSQTPPSRAATMAAAAAATPKADKSKKKSSRMFSFMKKKSKTMDNKDFSDIPFLHDPPAEQKLKCAEKIDELQRMVAKLENEREGMLKLKASYTSNPALGDAKMLEPKIVDIGVELDKRRLDLKKYKDFLVAVSKSSNKLNTAPNAAHRLSDYPDQPDTNNYYTGPPPVDVAEAGSHVSRVSHSSEDFDDDDDGNYSEIPDGGMMCARKCKVLYSYDRTTDAAISIREGEVLDILDGDNDDGWTKVRRNIDDIIEEGYVPTSYIKTVLDFELTGDHT